MAVGTAPKTSSNSQLYQPSFWQLANVWLKTKTLGAVFSQFALARNFPIGMPNLHPIESGSAMVL